MKFSKIEFNTKTNTAEIWNYTADGNKITESHKTMDFPVAQWADRLTVTEMMITLALTKETW